MNSTSGTMGDSVSEVSNAESLAEAIKMFSDAIENMSQTLKKCRAEGMSDGDIRDAIVMQLPEEDRPAFMMQWPMLSMMFSAL